MDANRSATPRVPHILSVDVEDYFMVEAFSGSVDRASWETWPSRVEANTRRTLDLFDRHNAKATFFLVGWVAERFPNLIREIHNRGHELACHSYWHRTIYSLTPDQFREDTRAAVHAVEDAAGVKLRGYRAPSWSITRDCLWALDILAEEGFSYDSSIYPIVHDIYGLPGAQRFPYIRACSHDMTLLEFPPATVQLFGTTLPAAGGGYLRILPLAYTHWAFRKFEREYRSPLVVYFHPWEIDPEQPRIRDRFRSRFRHYTNLRGMVGRLESILETYAFLPFRDVIEHIQLTPSLVDSPEPQAQEKSEECKIL